MRREPLLEPRRHGDRLRARVNSRSSRSPTTPAEGLSSTTWPTAASHRIPTAETPPPLQRLRHARRQVVRRHGARGHGLQATRSWRSRPRAKSVFNLQDPRLPARPQRRRQRRSPGAPTISRSASARSTSPGRSRRWSTSATSSRSEKPIEVYHVDWSPDGKYLAFSRGPTRQDARARPGDDRRRGPRMEHLRGRRRGHEPLGGNHARRPVEQGARLGARWGRRSRDEASARRATCNRPQTTIRLQARLTDTFARSCRSFCFPHCRSAPAVAVPARPKRRLAPPTIDDQDRGGDGAPPGRPVPQWARVDGKADESPLHEVAIDTFLMDRTEVTQEQYAKLVRRQPVALQRSGPARSSRSVGPRPRCTATCGRATKAWSPATTRRRPSATSRPTATVCRPRRNGNTPAGPERDAPYSLRRRRPATRASTPGTPRTPARRPSRSPRRSPTPGACSTCTATWPSGATTSYDAEYYRNSPAANPHGAGRRREVRAPRRGVELQRRGVPLVGPGGRRPRLPRRLLRPRRDRLPLRTTGRFGRSICRFIAAGCPANSAQNRGESRDEGCQSPEASPIGLLYDDLYLRHKTGLGHPERPERLTAIVEQFRTAESLRAFRDALAGCRRPTLANGSPHAGVRRARAADLPGASGPRRLIGHPGLPGVVRSGPCRGRRSACNGGRGGGRPGPKASSAPFARRGTTPPNRAHGLLPVQQRGHRRPLCAREAPVCPRS